MDIGTEELSHLEIVGTLARMHLKPTEVGPRRGRSRSTHRHRRRRRRQPVQLHGRCLDRRLFEDYRRTGRGSAQQYRRRGPRQDRVRTPDRFLRRSGSNDALQFLMTREITHMKAFTAALESMGKPPFSIGRHSADARVWWTNTSTIRPGSEIEAKRTPVGRGTKAATGKS